MSASVLHRGSFWAMVPVALLSGLVVTVLGLVHVAVTDPSFAVQDRYYARALSWDEHLAAERRSRALGWQADLSTRRGADGSVILELALRNRAGKPVHGARVDAEGASVARARSVARVSFVERADGHYEARLPNPEAGLFELTVDATRAEDRFTTTIRTEMKGRGAR